MAKYKSKNLLVLDGTLTSVDRNHKTMFSRREDKKKIAVMAAAVVFALLVLLIGARGMVSLCITLQEQEIIPGAVTEQTITYTDKDSLTAIVIKTNDDGTVPEQFVLTRYEPSEDAVYLTALAPELMMGERTLAGHYAVGGGAQCAAAVSDYVKTENVYYYTLEFNGVKSLVNEMGGVTIDLPCSINYNAPDSRRSINVAAGKRVFEGGETARLFNCPEWPGGVQQRRTIFVQMLAALVNENLAPSYSDRIEKIYGRVEPHAKTNVSMDVIQRCYDGLARLATANAEGNIALIMDVETYVNENGELKCSGDSYENLMMIYGDRGAPQQ